MIHVTDIEENVSHLATSDFPSLICLLWFSFIKYLVASYPSLETQFLSKSLTSKAQVEKKGVTPLL